MRLLSCIYLSVSECAYRISRIVLLLLLLLLQLRRIWYKGCANVRE